MVKNTLKLTTQTEKTEKDFLGYSKIAVKNGATLIFEATLIIARLYLEMCTYRSMEICLACVQFIQKKFNIVHITSKFK